MTIEERRAEAQARILAERPERERFGWGYQVGRSDAANRRGEKFTGGHFDRAYLAGYRAGVHVGTTGAATEDAAWEVFAWERFWEE